MEGAVLVERPNDNAVFYGTALTNQDILTGGVQPPAEAARLYALLKEIQEADLTPPPLDFIGLPESDRKTGSSTDLSVGHVIASGSTPPWHRRSRSQHRLPW